MIRPETYSVVPLLLALLKADGLLHEIDYLSLSKIFVFYTPTLANQMNWKPIVNFTTKQFNCYRSTLSLIV